MKHGYQVIRHETCAWPNLLHLQSGLIGAIIFNKPTHGHEEGSLELWVANAANLTDWSFQGCPCPHEPWQNRMHCACGISNDGTLHIVSTGYSVVNGRYGQLQPMWHSSSRDHGQSWSITKNISIVGTDRILVPYGSIVQDKNGILCTTAYSSYGRGNPSYTWVIQSRDNGLTWDLRSRIGEGDTNEAFLLDVDEYNWLVVTRTHVDHHTRLYRSEDSGFSWHDMGHLTLPMQHPGHLLRFNSNELFFTYGIRNKGLMAIGGRFSFDNGSSWRPPVVLYTFPEHATDCGYPSTVLVDEDTCITGCYTDLSTAYNGYQFGLITWSVSDYLETNSLRSISDYKAMTI